MNKQELVAILQEEFYLDVDVSTDAYEAWGGDTTYCTRVTVQLIDKETREIVLSSTGS
jgi:hypothetical protein